MKNFALLISFLEEHLRAYPRVPGGFKTKHGGAIWIWESHVDETFASDGWSVMIFEGYKRLMITAASDVVVPDEVLACIGMARWVGIPVDLTLGDERS